MGGSIVRLREDLQVSDDDEHWCGWDLRESERDSYFVPTNTGSAMDFILVKKNYYNFILKWYTHLSKNKNGIHES
jgi:hypothetical protein